MFSQKQTPFILVGVSFSDNTNEEGPTQTNRDACLQSRTLWIKQQADFIIASHRSSQTSKLLFSIGRKTEVQTTAHICFGQ